jgi:hypothetical protein
MPGIVTLGKLFFPIFLEAFKQGEKDGLRKSKSHCIFAPGTGRPAKS